VGARGQRSEKGEDRREERETRGQGDGRRWEDGVAELWNYGKLG